MTLDEEQRKAIVAFLNKSWEEPKVCHVCKHDEWTLAPNMYEIREFHGAGVFGTAGKIIPFIVVSCNNCGNTRFFNAITMGVLKREVEKEGQK